MYDGLFTDFKRMLKTAIVFPNTDCCLICQAFSANNWNLSCVIMSPRKSIMEIFDRKSSLDSPKSPISVTKNLLDIGPSSEVSSNTLCPGS